MKAEVKDQEKSQDTSEDSGIVTDDSEARAVSLNSKYYEVRRSSFSQRESKAHYEELWNSKTSNCSAEPETLLKPPPDDSDLYEMAEDIENLQRFSHVFSAENKEKASEILTAICKGYKEGASKAASKDTHSLRKSSHKKSSHDIELRESKKVSKNQTR